MSSCDLLLILFRLFLWLLRVNPAVPDHFLCLQLLIVYLSSKFRGFQFVLGAHFLSRLATIDVTQTALMNILGFYSRKSVLGRKLNFIWLHWWKQFLAPRKKTCFSVPGRVIPKTLKMALDTPLLSTLQYKVRIKDKVEQFRGRSSTLPYTFV